RVMFPAQPMSRIMASWLIEKRSGSRGTMLRRECGRQKRYFVLRKYIVVDGAPPRPDVDDDSCGGSGSLEKPWKPPSRTTSAVMYFSDWKPASAMSGAAFSVVMRWIDCSADR